MNKIPSNTISCALLVSEGLSLTYGCLTMQLLQNLVAYNTHLLQGGQESEHGLARSYAPGVSQEPAIKVSGRVGISSEASNQERSACKLTSVAVGRLPFLRDCWPEAILSFSNMAACFI